MKDVTKKPRNPPVSLAPLEFDAALTAILAVKITKEDDPCDRLSQDIEDQGASKRKNRAP